MKYTLTILFFFSLAGCGGRKNLNFNDKTSEREAEQTPPVVTPAPATPPPATPAPTPTPTPVANPTPVPVLPPPGPVDSLTWIKKDTSGPGVPGATGYTTILYDPASRKILVPSQGLNIPTIYVHAWYAYDPLTNIFEYIPNAGDRDHSNTCRESDSLPFNVHPYRQILVDEFRNKLVQINGANQNCPSTLQHFEMSLNSNPVVNSWTKISTQAADVPYNATVESAMTHDTINDIYFLYGGMYKQWVYCPTVTLSAAQISAGCKSAKTWSEVTLLNGYVNVNGTSVTRRSGDAFNQVLKAGDYIYVINGFYMVQTVTNADSLTLVNPPPVILENQPWYVTPTAVASVTLNFDRYTGRVIFYGGSNLPQSTTYNSTWGYDLPMKKWRHLALAGPQPPIDCTGSGCNGDPVQNIGQSVTSFRASTHQLFYHCIAGTNCPSDWVYDTMADSWSQVKSTGTGTVVGRGAVMTYSPACDCLITYTPKDGALHVPEIWVGRF
jgi:hypothetical protein